jgi:hypothetical protein
MLGRLGPAARQLAETFADNTQSSYDVTELDGLVPHHTGRDTAMGLSELRLCRLVEIRRGIPTSSRSVSRELQHIDSVEVLPALRSLFPDNFESSKKA